jgi:hypothetical protein
MNDVTGRTNDEIMGALAARAQQDGDDWRVKIARQDSPNGRIESLATFDAATVEQIANADSWIPPLMGGTGSSGSYLLYLTHSVDRKVGRTTAMIRLPALAGAPIASDKINWATVDSPGWMGPKALVYPTPNSMGTGGAPSGSVSPRQTNGVPPVPSFDPNRPGADVDYARAQLAAERERLAEDRRKAEIEAIRRESQEAQRRSDAHLAELRDLVKTVASQKAPTTDITQTITTIVAAITPLVAPLLTSRSAAEVERVRAEQARIEREESRRREDQQREEARAAEAQKRQDTLMERVANQGAEVAKVMAAMSEASATMTRTMLQTMTSAIEMGLGAKPQEEEGWSGIAKAFFSAMGERVAVGMTQPPAAPALPPRPAAPATPQQPFSGAQPPAAAGNEVSVLDQIVMRIAQRDPDINGLAGAIIAAMQSDEETQAAIESAGGNIITMFQSRLGNEWANDPANQQYAAALLTQLAPLAKAAGLASDEEPG